MGDFSADWLSLRTAADSRARADDLVRRAGLVPGGAAERPLPVLDLGCGTGANLRHLAPLLGDAGARDQHWTCVDRDDALLARLPERCGAWAVEIGLAASKRAGALLIDAGGWRCRVRALSLDLAAERLRLPMPTAGLVSASALLDLVSAAWLDALLAACHAERCALLFALSYDGRCRLTPAHADDAFVVDRVNRHQRSDKGFGPALGPDAAGHAAARCAALGYRVDSAASDWHLEPGDAALQLALVDGWRQAAMTPGSPRGDADSVAAGRRSYRAEGPREDVRRRIDAWHRARRDWIARGRSRILVGHRDLVATPPA